MNMLEKIQSQLEHLSKSERKVAEVISASPDNAIHSSIAALALEANVSEPTVNRFCRSICTRAVFLILNFIWHKVWRCRSPPDVNRNVNEDDSVESYTGKIFESAMATLIMSVIHWINLPSTAPSTCSLRQKKSPFSD